MLLAVIIIILNSLTETFAQDSQPAQNPSVIMNEIAAFEESGFEWIEILNISEISVDLADFSFYENATKHKLKAVQNDLNLEPNEFAVIAQDADKFLQKNIGFTGTLIDSSWDSLKESGEEIGIVDSAGNFLEKFTYIPAKDTSLERKNPKIPDYTEQNWLTHASSGTPGSINSCAAQTESIQTEQPPQTNTEANASESQPEAAALTSSANNAAPAASNSLINSAPETAESANAPQPKVYINEVSLRDSSTDWVEIAVLNSDSAPADLSGYSIWTDSMLFKIPEDTNTAGGAYYTASLENTDGIPATTEQIILKDKDGMLVDAMCVTNGTVAQNEIKNMQSLFESGMWISHEPAACVDISKMQKSWTVGRKIPLNDSNSKDDFEIFKHSTKNSPNEFSNSNPIPIINIQTGNITGEAPFVVNFTASASSDPEDDAIKFFWDFGDKTFEETANPQAHTYATPGTYNVALAVEDEFSGKASANLTVNVIPKTTLQGFSSKQPVQVLVASNSVKTPVKNQQKKTTSANAAKKTASVKKTSAPKKNAKINSAEKPAPAAPQNGDLSRSLLVTEIMPNPEGSDADEEWVEIFNPENRPVNLSNWILDDEEGGSKPYIFPSAAVIGPKEYLVLSREETKISLNNSKDSVRLFDFLRNLIFEVSYAKAESDKSYIKTANGFEWTSDVTPGRQNPKYRLIAGQIEDVNSEEKTILIAGADGPANISFDENLLHPMIAPMTLPKGGTAFLEIEEEKNGDFNLHKIQSVAPPPKERESKTSYMPWVIGAVIAISLITNIWFVIANLWPRLRERFTKNDL